MRPKLVVGNWKLNTRRDEAQALAQALAAGWSGSAQVRMVVCPPAVHIPVVAAALEGSRVALGAQNLAEQPEGAFTGEIAGEMLADYGCGFVIVGHSERRALFGETNAVVASKMLRALDSGLTPIVCIGETLAEREAGQVEAVIGTQLDALVAAATAGLAGIVLAYEPIWAIGTGQTASPAQAQAVHAFIRDRLSAANPAWADVPVLYGGSVKADNAASLFAEQDIDGALVGGASLAADDFLAIGQQALQA